MCELIVSVIDKTSDDPGVERMMVKRGVVVDVMEDGHAWGRMELTHPMWRILKLPGAPLAVGRALLGGEPDDGSGNPLLLHRHFKLDLDHPAIPADLRAHLADDTRAAPHATLDPALLVTLKTRRPSLPRPNVIGQPAHIIG